ncbi:hypothetical protein C2S51_028500 [Perilla frutescens var. frutescens]|nr:hypothetical protein C2S51_028500 [Perilla frutescens var. frutescens]
MSSSHGGRGSGANKGKGIAYSDGFSPRGQAHASRRGRGQGFSLFIDDTINEKMEYQYHESGEDVAHPNPNISLRRVPSQRQQEQMEKEDQNLAAQLQHEEIQRSHSQSQ